MADRTDTLDTDGNVQCVSCGITIPADASCPHCGVVNSVLRAAAKQDERVLAIRADTLIGVDTCSFIDDCLDAIDIVETLDRENIDTPVDAIMYFIEAQDAKNEMALVAPTTAKQIKAYDDWRVSRDVHLLALAN